MRAAGERKQYEQIHRARVGEDGGGGIGEDGGGCIGEDGGGCIGGRGESWLSPSVAAGSTRVSPYPPPHSS